MKDAFLGDSRTFPLSFTLTKTGLRVGNGLTFIRRLLIQRGHKTQLAFFLVQHYPVQSPATSSAPFDSGRATDCSP